MKTTASIEVEVPAIEAWRRAAERIRADRIFVMPAPDADADADGLESVRAGIHPRAGAYLPDDTPVDARAG